MFGTPFGHGTLRKYVIFFGTLFNNIWLQRFDINGALIQNMKVPLGYGPREKFLARADGNPEGNRPIAIQLPRMSFEMTNMYYDPTRKLNSINKIGAKDPTNNDIVWYQYSPVPYNFEFQLSIMVKNAEDGTYIIEQILPYFTPDWKATLNLNTDMGQKHDVPVILSSVSSEDTYEGSFTERRALIWTLTFTMKGWLFGPTKKTGPGTKVIKEIDVNLRIPPRNIEMDNANPNNTATLVDINITPGMFANGVATSAAQHDYTYGLANSSGSFITGELVAANSSAYTYVVSSNSTHLVARNVHGNLTTNSVITGAFSGSVATINSISVSPLSVSANSIGVDDDYGFIVDFMEF